MNRLRVEQRRGSAVESVHEITAVMCNASGHVIGQLGADWVTTFRSAAKPFQLEATLGCLAPERVAQLSMADLAIGASSHHGQPMHVSQVVALLHQFGLDTTCLHCGAHAPSHGPSAAVLAKSGQDPSALHNNCSGKHTFMAAACRAQSWPADYRPIDHPLQRRILERLNLRTNGRVQTTVVDGCGVPCFVLPLSAMAQAWASPAVEMECELVSVLGSIARAMRALPQMMSGTDAFDGWLIEHTGVVAKIGAAGLLCIALPNEGLGIAIKAVSGADAVRPVAARAVLDCFVPGLLREPLPEQFVVVTNVAGARVGEIVAVEE